MESISHYSEGDAEERRFLIERIKKLKESFLLDVNPYVQRLAMIEGRTPQTYVLPTGEAYRFVPPKP